MENKELTLYSKDKIVELVSSMLKYCGKSEYKKEVVKASHLLMDKVRYCDGENITLEPDFIEEILLEIVEKVEFLREKSYIIDREAAGYGLLASFD